ncbi:hypothetical protein QFZ22_000052 [Streptomyces canus]|uniref:Uncharacterized protein n=1 Tax=Streptomyces canus TaxID=58343 RepID=A0AAW8F1W5_9ACTN|nr:hypothetical protein [Streptomyces canus]MDQ0904067.1 hypothetical protein [Streptomyces canus]
MLAASAEASKYRQANRAWMPSWAATAWTLRSMVSSTVAGVKVTPLAGQFGEGLGDGLL